MADDLAWIPTGDYIESQQRLAVHEAARHPRLRSSIRQPDARRDAPADDLESLRDAAGTPAGAGGDERLQEATSGTQSGGIVGSGIEMGLILGPERRQDA